MKLKIREKVKAENYSGDSITYILPKFNLEQKIILLKEIQQLENIELIKIKIEYIDIDNTQQIDSVYSKILSKNNYLKYQNINYMKIKALINNTKISFTVDFLDNYLRIKSDYNNDFSEKNIYKIIEKLQNLF
jgi:hypothetical protein